MWRASMKAFPFVDEVCRRRRWPGPTNPDLGAAGAPEVCLASENVNRNWRRRSVLKIRIAAGYQRIMHRAQRNRRKQHQCE